LRARPQGKVDGRRPSPSAGVGGLDDDTFVAIARAIGALRRPDGSAPA
jgi:hypothetical protein